MGSPEIWYAPSVPVRFLPFCRRSPVSGRPTVMPRSGFVRRDPSAGGSIPVSVRAVVRAAAVPVRPARIAERTFSAPNAASV